MKQETWNKIIKLFYLLSNKNNVVLLALFQLEFTYLWLVVVSCHVNKLQYLTNTFIDKVSIPFLFCIELYLTETEINYTTENPK